MAPQLASLSELQRRLAYSLFKPAAEICRRLSVPLDTVEQLCRLAYFEELRRGGTTQAEVAKVFGRSRRTVIGVERQFNSDFLAPEKEVDLNRRVEEVLATGPVTAAELAERVGADPEVVRRMVDGLVGAGRAESRGVAPTGEPRFVLSERFQSLVRDDLLARITGLKHQLEVISAAVRQRFLPVDGEDRPSVARTVSFVGTPEDTERFMNELIRSVRLGAIDVEESGLKKGGYERYAVTFVGAPVEEQGGTRGVEDRRCGG